MGQDHHYQLPLDGIEVYERYIVPGVMRPFAMGLIDAVTPQPDDTIVDVACGTGVVSRLLASEEKNRGHIVGADISPSMIATARREAKSQALMIEFAEAPANALPFASNAFDVALCHHGLQYFQDRGAALNEIRRVLRPGGRFGATVWRPVTYNPGHHAFANALERHVSAEAAAERRAPFALCDAAALRSLFRQAGFKTVHVTLDARVARFPSPRAMIEIMAAGSPLANVLMESGPGRMELVIREVEDALADYIDDVGLALPMQAWIAVGTA